MGLGWGEGGQLGREVASLVAPHVAACEMTNALGRLSRTQAEVGAQAPGRQQLWPAPPGAPGEPPSPCPSTKARIHQPPVRGQLTDAWDSAQALLTPTEIQVPQARDPDNPAPPHTHLSHRSYSNTSIPHSPKVYLLQGAFLASHCTLLFPISSPKVKELTSPHFQRYSFTFL